MATGRVTGESYNKGTRQFADPDQPIDYVDPFTERENMGDPYELIRQLLQSRNPPELKRPGVPYGSTNEGYPLPMAPTEMPAGSSAPPEMPRADLMQQALQEQMGGGRIDPNRYFEEPGLNDDSLDEMNEGMPFSTMDSSMNGGRDALYAAQDMGRRKSPNQRVSEGFEDLESDEAMMDGIGDKLNGPRPEDDREWPSTVEEFKAKYGREPATDSEVEFYYPDEPDTEDDLRKGR